MTLTTQYSVPVRLLGSMGLSIVHMPKLLQVE